MTKKIISLGIFLLFLLLVLSGCTNTPTNQPTQLAIQSFEAQPQTIQNGNSSLLAWVVVGATNISIDQGIGSVTSTGSYTVKPLVTTTYTLFAAYAEKSVTSSQTVYVTQNQTNNATPTITFEKVDTAINNTLTVTTVSSPQIHWQDIDLKVNEISTDHGVSGMVTIGDILDITSIAGTGTYVISLIYIPTQSLLGTYSFTASEEATLSLTFLKIDEDSINSLTVESAYPSTLTWNNLSITARDTNGADISSQLTIPTSGQVLVGQTITCPAGAFTVEIRYTPLNMLLGFYPFIAGLIPTITFDIIDEQSINMMTVLSATPSTLTWENIELRISTTTTDHRLSGIVKIGDVLDLTPLAGTGSYIITLIYTPTDTLITMHGFIGLE